MPERLKVLVVTYGTPYPPNSGVAMRDFNLLKCISRSVELYLCILATEATRPEVSALEQFCAQIITVPAVRRSPIAVLSNSIACWRSGYRLATHPYFYSEMADAIGSIVRNKEIDILQIEHSFLAAYRSAVPAGSQCRTILSLHNVGSRQYSRIARTQPTFSARLSYLLKAFLIKRMESASLGKFDRCVVVSREEASLLKEAAPGVEFSIVENGIDCENLRPLPPSKSNKNLLFIGVINYPPNSDAVLYFCKSILPIVRRSIPEVTLTVIGHSPPIAVQRLAATHGITVTGFVDDVVPYYDRSSICIVPLRAGGGTRLKILEAMARGRPVVSTSIGCEGLHVKNGEHLLIGDTADEFARHVIELLRNEGLRGRISTGARELVEKRYDWPRIAKKLLRTYEEVKHGAAGEYTKLASKPLFESR